MRNNIAEAIRLIFRELLIFSVANREIPKLTSNPLDSVWCLTGANANTGFAFIVVKPIL